jgi:mRNA interferase YafQ
MLKPIYTNQFKRDLKLIKKRGKNIRKLKSIITKVSNEELLDPKYKEHKLIGKYKGRLECHIEPNWLLIYQVTNNLSFGF